MARRKRFTNPEDIERAKAISQAERAANKALLEASSTFREDVDEIDRKIRRLADSLAQSMALPPDQIEDRNVFRQRPTGAGRGRRPYEPLTSTTLRGIERSIDALGREREERHYTQTIVSPKGDLHTLGTQQMGYTPPDGDAPLGPRRFRPEDLHAREGISLDEVRADMSKRWNTDLGVIKSPIDKVVEFIDKYLFGWVKALPESMRQPVMTAGHYFLVFALIVLPILTLIKLVTL